MSPLQSWPPSHSSLSRQPGKHWPTRPFSRAQYCPLGHWPLLTHKVLPSPAISISAPMSAPPAPPEPAEPPAPDGPPGAESSQPPRASAQSTVRQFSHSRHLKVFKGTPSRSNSSSQKQVLMPPITVAQPRSRSGGFERRRHRLSDAAHPHCNLLYDFLWRRR